MASRGYCWGRHLRLMLKAFGCEQESGEATSEGEEGTPEGLGAKSDERRLWIPEGKRRSGPTVRMLYGEYIWNSTNLCRVT